MGFRGDPLQDKYWGTSSEIPWTPLFFASPNDEHDLQTSDNEAHFIEECKALDWLQRKQ